jgi:hypothetical protein
VTTRLGERDLWGTEPESLTVGQLNQAVRELREAVHMEKIRAQAAEYALRSARASENTGGGLRAVLDAETLRRREGVRAVAATCDEDRAWDAGWDEGIATAVNALRALAAPANRETGTPGPWVEDGQGFRAEATEAADALEDDGHIRACGNGGEDPEDCSPACVAARRRPPSPSEETRPAGEGSNQGKEGA